MRWPFLISHQSALAIHELSDVSPARIHVTLPTAVRLRRDIPKVLVIHSADLDATDVERVQGSLYTTPHPGRFAMRTPVTSATI